MVVISLNISKLHRHTALVAVLAAIYAVVTISLGSLSYEWIQVRVSEALTPLPLIFGFPAAIGLTLGCIIANAFSPVGLPDLIFGPVLTFLAAVFSWKLSFDRKLLACCYPVVVNAFGVSAYLSGFYGIPYAVSVIAVGTGEFVSAVLIGYPLLRAIANIVRRDLQS